MAFAAPPRREGAGPWHRARWAESGAGLTGIQQDRITLKILPEAVSSCSPSKPGICRWACESSTFQERLWTHPVSKQVLRLGFPGGFSAGKELLWLCSQTNIWGFKGSRERLLCPMARWCGGAGIGIIFYARRLCDPAEALGLRERLSNTTPTFLTRRRENSLLLICSILLGFQVFFLAVSAYHKLGKWPREENTWSDSLVVVEMAVGRLNTRPEPGYVMETRTAVKQGKGSLTFLQSKINNKGEAQLLLGI